jgi:hypothetical protein
MVDALGDVPTLVLATLEPDKLAIAIAVPVIVLSRWNSACNRYSHARTMVPMKSA